jgi:hypothetical protein
MKLALIVALLGFSTTARDAGGDAAEDVKAAVAKVADAANYTWTRDLKGSRSSWTVEGKADKDGLVWLLVNDRGQREGLWKGETWAVKTEGGWKGPADAMPGGGVKDPGNMIMGLKNIGVATSEALQLLGGTKELKSEGNGTYSGDLTDDLIKDLWVPGSSKATNLRLEKLKGSVKFWLKGETLSKYEFKISGTSVYKNGEAPFDRTITTTFKDVGSTKIQIPAEAKAKMN